MLETFLSLLQLYNYIAPASLTEKLKKIEKLKKERLIQKEIDIQKAKRKEELRVKEMERNKEKSRLRKIEKKNEKIAKNKEIEDKKNRAIALKLKEQQRKKALVVRPKYSKRRCSAKCSLVMIVRVIFIGSFLFYCLLLSHSFPTDPNKITNCFQLILSSNYNFANYICSMRSSIFDF